MRGRSWRSSLSKRCLTGAFIVFAALPLASCNTTPTLPLPPPVASASAPDEQGFALVRGEASAEAYVSILNERSESGVITRADPAGRFEALIRAQVGDPLTIRQEIDGELSEPFYTTVLPPR